MGIHLQLPPATKLNLRRNCRRSLDVGEQNGFLEQDMVDEVRLADLKLADDGHLVFWAGQLLGLLPEGLLPLRQADLADHRRSVREQLLYGFHGVGLFLGL